MGNQSDISAENPSGVPIPVQPPMPIYSDHDMDEIFMSEVEEEDEPPQEADHDAVLCPKTAHNLKNSSHISPRMPKELVVDIETAPFSSNTLDSHNQIPSNEIQQAEDKSDLSEVPD